MTGSNWVQLSGGSTNPWNIIRDDGTYTASYGDHVISDGGTVTLPSPQQGAAVAVSEIGNSFVTVDGGSAQVEQRSTLNTSNGNEDEVVFISDGSNWYIANDLDNAAFIPDSAIAQYDAQALSASDGDAISTLPDSINGYDATGEATYRSNGINSNPSLEFDATDDGFFASGLTQTQPLTVISVVDLQDTGVNYYVFYDDSGSILKGWRNSDVWRLFAGTNLEGSATQSSALLTGLYDGANSAIREDGSQTNSGNAGAGDINGFRIGTDDGGGDTWDGLIGEIIVYDTKLSGTELDREEQRLADKWDISI